MEARDYHSNMRLEVDHWKTKAHDVMGRFDDLPTEEMETLRPFLRDLKAVIEEHTARLEDLSMEFPSELNAQRFKTERFTGLKKFWQDLGKYRRYRIHL